MYTNINWYVCVQNYQDLSPTYPYPFAHEYTNLCWYKQDLKDTRNARAECRTGEVIAYIVGGEQG